MGLFNFFGFFDSRTVVLDLDAWRFAQARIVHTIFVVVIPVLVPVRFSYYQSHDLLWLVALDTLIWLWCLLTVFLGNKYRFFRPRPWVSLGLIFGLMTVHTAESGLMISRIPWRMSFILLATLLYGIRGALFSLVSTVLMLIVLYFSVDPAHHGWQDVFSMTRGELFSYGLSSFGITVVIAVAVLNLVEGLQASLTKEAKARKELLKEQQEVVAAYDKLKEESASKKELEGALRQAQRLEAVGQLASGIAHDLNNFLLPMALNAELAASSLPADAAAQDDLKAIISSAGQASELVQQILLFTRDVPPSDSFVEINQLLGELEAHIAVSLPSSCKMDFALGSPLKVWANKTALFQVFTNIAHNAIDAMQEQGGLLRFEVSKIESSELEKCACENLDSKKTWFSVTISDTGMGMEPEVAARVYEPFYTTKPLGEGTGLGLATAYGIVEAMGGHIRLESQPNEGSQFTVYFEVGSEEVSANASAKSEREKSADFRKEVILVDDNLRALKPLRRSIEKLGIGVTAFQHAQEAIDAVRDGASADLVVSGLHVQ